MRVLKQAYCRLAYWFHDTIAIQLAVFAVVLVLGATRIVPACGPAYMVWMVVSAVMALPIMWGWPRR